MCINDSWRQVLIICSTLWQSGSVPQWITCCLVKHTSHFTCARAFRRLISSVCWDSAAVLPGCQCIVGTGDQIFFRANLRSVSRELIISQQKAHRLQPGCRRAQAAKCRPYCAYSPHLKSLCCAVHSGPPVQLFLYKKLQNSILQREKNRDKQWAGGRRQKQH